MLTETVVGWAGAGGAGVAAGEGGRGVTLGVCDGDVLRGRAVGTRRVRHEEGVGDGAAVGDGGDVGGLGDKELAGVVGDVDGDGVGVVGGDGVAVQVLAADVSRIEDGVFFRVGVGGGDGVGAGVGPGLSAEEAPILNT